ncbi:unnamed protein product, partial [Nesidiocoris tenuis]
INLSTVSPDEKKYEVYFDETWRPVPLLAVVNSSTVIRMPQRRYGLLPCECQELECGCCVNTNFFSTKRSAKNPPPACMEAPIPYLPSMQFCIRLFDIYTRGQNIHMCVNFETRISRAPIMILEFDCFQMGVDGIEHMKFNSTSSPGAKFTTISPTTDPTTIDYESTTERVETDITTTEQFVLPLNFPRGQNQTERFGKLDGVLEMMINSQRRASRIALSLFLISQNEPADDKTDSRFPWPRVRRAAVPPLLWGTTWWGSTRAPSGSQRRPHPRRPRPRRPKPRRPGLACVSSSRCTSRRVNGSSTYVSSNSGTTAPAQVRPTWCWLVASSCRGGKRFTTDKHR